MQDKKENKIVFNKTIDDAISGYSLAITFIGIGIFLINNLEYFGNKIVSIIILSIFSIIGVIGTFVELNKISGIKGMDDLTIGGILFTGWIIIYLFVNKLLLNIIGFILLFFGVYGMVTGIIKIGVSMFYKESKTGKILKRIIVNLLKLLPAIASFVLVIFNIIKIVVEIKQM